MSFQIKKGVRIFGQRPEMLKVDLVVTGVFQEYGYDAIQTGGVEGKHSRESFHYNGLASDYRTRHVAAELLKDMRDKIAARLPDDFDVILESDHIHIEFQPKDPLTA
jgi:hypothetical protein